MKILNHWWKFAAQTLATLVMIYFGGTMLLSFGDMLGVGDIQLRSAAVPATLFCVVGVVNAVNMIDGLDGLLGGISLIAFFAFALLAFINGQPELMLVSVAFSGALVAFLRYNWGEARLFLGDAGSLSIGFALAFLAIAITQKENSFVDPAAPLLVLAVPIVDAVVVIFNRMKKGKSPFHADKNHLHHILLRFDFSKKYAVKFILFLSAIMAAIGVAGTLLHIHEHYLFAVFLAYGSLYAVASASIRDVLEAYLRNKHKRSAYHQPAFWLAAVMRVLDVLKNSQREQRRYLSQMPIVCTVNGEAFAGTVSDISGGGLSARFHDGFQRGQKIDACILIMKDEGAVQFSPVVEVVWKRKLEREYIHGFKFSSVQRDSVPLLKKIMQR